MIITGTCAIVESSISGSMHGLDFLIFYRSNYLSSSSYLVKINAIPLLRIAHFASIRGDCHFGLFLAYARISTMMHSFVAGFVAVHETEIRVPFRQRVRKIWAP